MTSESIPLMRPDVRFDEVADDLRAIFESGTLTGGRYVAGFEEAIAAKVGASHAVTTTSATTALHLALVAYGVGPGDEVLVSDFTFPATGNVVVQLGATPVMVDSLPDAFALDVEEAASKLTPRTRAIVPVDPFGQPADMAAVRRLAREHGLAVVEDAACALGASLDGVPCGGGSGAGCFSFHPRKIVTTGEGGAVTTDDAGLADTMRRLRTHGGVRAEVGLTFVDNGFNYRLGEVPAAIGLAQLARLDRTLDDRRRTAARYDERLADLPGVEVRSPRGGEVWTYQSYVVVLDENVDRDAVIGALRHDGIETTLGTYAMHAHPAFARFGYVPGDLPWSYAAQQRSLTLPLLPAMPERDVDRVVSSLAVAVTAARSAHR